MSSPDPRTASGRLISLGPGARLGEWILERQLGRGGMGSVYVARHATTRHERALKTLHAMSGAQAKERFAREARALAKVDKHPGIVDIHAADVQDGIPYLVLELVSGGDLEAAIRGGRLEVSRAVRIGRGVAEALAHIHRAGIVHRDLKPGNVLLREPRGEPVLTDFGIVRDADEARLTATGAIVGSPRYMAPEQIVGDRSRVGPASDVFALGVILHEALTGEQPFAGESLVELARALHEDEPERASSSRPDVPRDLEGLILAMLRREPPERPTAEQVALALAAIERGEGTPFGRTSTGSRVAERLGLGARGRARLVVGALALVALFAGATAWGFARVAERDARAVVASHAAWERDVLAPWLERAAGGEVDPTVELAELEARALALEAAAASVDAAGGAEARLAADRLAAARRLLLAAARAVGAAAESTEHAGTDESASAKPGPAEAAAWVDAGAGGAGAGEGAVEAGGSTTALVVDALLLERRGDVAGALRRAEQALARAPDDPAARAAELRVRALAEPRVFLARARALPRGSPGRPLAERLAPAALARAVKALCAQAPAATTEEVRAELLELERARVDLGASTARVVTARAAALELGAPRWDEALERARARGAEADALERLGALLRFDPPSGAGPALRRVVARHLLALLEEQAAAASVRDERAARALSRLLDAEAIVVAEVDPTRRPPAALTELLDRTLAVRLWPTVDRTSLVVATLRASRTHGLRALAQYLDREAVQRQRRRWPRSRAVRLAEALIAPPATATGDEGDPLWTAVLDQTLQDDLAPFYEAEAIQALAQRLHARLAASSGAAIPPLARQVIELARRPSAQELRPEDLVSLAGLESDALIVLGRTEEGIAARAAVIPTVRARIGQPGSFPDIDQHALASAHLRLAELLERLGLPDEALARAREAVAEQAKTDAGDDHSMRTIEARLLRKRGDVAAAREIVEARLHHMADNGDLAVELVRTRIAAGDLDAAGDALRWVDGPATRAQLADEVARARAPR